MKIEMITGEKEKPFLELAKEGAEYIIEQNRLIYKNDIATEHTCYDNCYITYTQKNEFSILSRADEAKYIFLYFRLMTMKGKLRHCGHINVIDVENSVIYELDHSINIENNRDKNEPEAIQANEYYLTEPDHIYGMMRKTMIYVIEVKKKIFTYKVVDWTCDTKTHQTRITKHYPPTKYGKLSDSEHLRKLNKSNIIELEQ